MSNQPLNPDSLAEQLDALLPADSPGEINSGHQDDPLLAAAAHLAAAPSPALSPEAMARIQAQMLQAFDQQRFERSARRVRVHPALRWVLVAGLAFVVLFAASVPSALASVPGDWLYPVKGMIEQAELGLAASPESRAAVYLTFAERRTREASVLAGQGAFDPTLFQAALSNLAQASDTAHNAGLALPVLQARAVGIKAQLDTVLLQAASHPEIPPAVVEPMMTQVQATQNAGGLLLPPATETHTPAPTNTAAPTLTPTVTPTITPSPATATFTPSATPSPVTATPTLTVTPSPEVTVTATATLEINFAVEGVVEGIEDNVIIIYGFRVTLAPDDPLLPVIRIGDVLRVEGRIGGNATIRATEVDPVGDDIAVSPDGQSTWRDSGDCGNPPPPWAPAHGWRARCGGQGGQSAPGNSGNNGNRGGGNRGRGRGNNNDDN